MKRTLGFVLASAAVITACDDNGDGLGPLSGPLRLEASIERPVVGSGDTALLIFRVVNVGEDSITLTFGNTCQTLPYITRANGDPVIPTGGSWGCRGMVTQLRLAPGAADTTARIVRACASYKGPVMLHGDYKAYARFVHPDYLMRSQTIAFQVRCT